MEILVNIFSCFFQSEPTHALGNEVSSLGNVRLYGLKKSLESIEDLSKVLVLQEHSGKCQCYNQSEVNSQNGVSLDQFIITNLKNVADLKQFKIAELQKIASIAAAALREEQAENAQNLLKLIEQHLIAELDQWETEGDKAEAIRRIIEAFKKKSEELDLSKLGLTSLPAVIALLTHLKILDVSYNKLGSLPHWIGYLARLVELYLGYNLFPSLPSEIGNLTALTHLDVHGNQLRWLPDTIGNLTALTRLTASGCVE